MKYATKLTLLFSIIFLITGAMLSYLVYTTESDLLIKHIRDRLENQAFHSLDKIDRLLYERRLDINALANDPVIRTRTSSVRQIAETLQNYKEVHKEMYTSISFFNMDRVRIADTSGKDIGKAHALTKYWKGIDAGKNFVIDISKSQSLQETVLHLASVVRDTSGAPFGVIVFRLPVEHIYDIVRQGVGIYSIGKGFKIDLLTNEGVILYSDYNPSSILKDISPDWEDVKQALKEGKGFGSYRHIHPGIGDEIHAFAVEKRYQDFTGSGWTLLIHAPVNIVLAPVVKTRNMLIFILFISYIVIILIILFSSRLITRHINSLIHISQEIGRGNLDVKIELKSKDELGHLAAVFDKMAIDLKENQERLLAYSNELEAKVAKRTAELKIELDRRTKAQEGLERRSKAMNILSHMTELLQTCNTEKEAYLSIKESAEQLFPDNPGVVLCHDNSKNMLEPVAVWGTPPLNEQDVIPADCWAMQVMGQAHRVDGTQAGLNCNLAEAVSGTHICIPITGVKDEFIGVVHLLIEPAGEKGEDADILIKEKNQVAISFASRLGISLSNLKLRESLHNLAIRDQLTGLYNRRYIEESFERELLRAKRNSLHLGVVMIDIDHFKRFNDTLGHAAGDALLRALGKFLLQNIRRSDIVCRYGGEEFLLILPETSLGIAVQRAETLCEKVKKLQVEHENRLLEHITLSLGVAVFPDNGETMDAIIKAADTALYRAKEEGRNRVCVAEGK